MTKAALILFVVFLMDSVLTSCLMQHRMIGNKSLTRESILIARNNSNEVILEIKSSISFNEEKFYVSSDKPSYKNHGLIIWRRGRHTPSTLFYYNSIVT